MLAFIYSIRFFTLHGLFYICYNLRDASDKENPVYVHFVC